MLNQATKPHNMQCQAQQSS